MLWERHPKKEPQLGKVQVGPHGAVQPLLLHRRLSMAAVQQQFSKPVPSLYIAFELGWDKWGLAFGTVQNPNARQRNVKGRDLAAVQAEIASAKAKLGLASDAPV